MICLRDESILSTIRIKLEFYNYRYEEAKKYCISQNLTGCVSPNLNSCNIPITSDVVVSPISKFH